MWRLRRARLNRQHNESKRKIKTDSNDKMHKRVDIPAEFTIARLALVAVRMEVFFVFFQMRFAEESDIAALQSLLHGHDNKCFQHLLAATSDSPDPCSSDAWCTNGGPGYCVCLSRNHTACNYSASLPPPVRPRPQSCWNQLTPVTKLDKKESETMSNR